MKGLADDGGLFVPDSWPQVDLDHLKSLKSFIDVAKYIVPMYTDSSFSKDEVYELLDNTWHDFEEKDYLKIVDINPRYKKAIIKDTNKYIESLVALILSAINPANIAHSGLRYERLLIVEAAFSLL